MLNNIVGIKYIGNKPNKTDNVANTGATWVPGEVHNFSSAIAHKLLAHPDVFELADVSQTGSTYMGGNVKKDGIKQEPVAYVNLHNMDAKALVAYARLNFNRTLDDKETPEKLRDLVSKLMSNATLDEIQEELQAQEAKASTRETEFIGLEVSQEEYALYQSGDLVLKLVPVYTGPAFQTADTFVAPADSTQPQGITLQPVDNSEGKLTITLPEGAAMGGGGGAESGLTELEQSADAEAEASRQQLAQATAETAQAQPEEELADILAKLEKPQLLKLAKEQGIRVSNTMTADVLRGKILEAQK